VIPIPNSVVIMGAIYDSESAGPPASVHGHWRVLVHSDPGSVFFGAFTNRLTAILQEQICRV
jgi:hypothetical protein